MRQPLSRGHPSRARRSLLPLARASAHDAVVPLSSSSGPSPPCVVIFPYPLNRITIAPHRSLGQHDASRAIQPVFLPTDSAPRQSTSAPPVASRSLPSAVSGPPSLGQDAHASAACVRASAGESVRSCARARARVRVIIIRREQLYEEPTASDPFTLC